MVCAARRFRRECEDPTVASKTDGFNQKTQSVATTMSEQFTMVEGIYSLRPGSWLDVGLVHTPSDDSSVARCAPNVFSHETSGTGPVAFVVFPCHNCDCCDNVTRSGRRTLSLCFGSTARSSYPCNEYTSRKACFCGVYVNQDSVSGHECSGLLYCSCVRCRVLTRTKKCRHPIRSFMLGKVIPNLWRLFEAIIKRTDSSRHGQ